MKFQMNRNLKYSASFTTATGGLYLREVNAVLPYIMSINATHLLNNEVHENKLLRINSQTTRKRVITQITNRINYSFNGFWDNYNNAQENHRALMLFFLVLKAFPLAYDFHFNVTLLSWKGSIRGFDIYSYQMKIDDIGNEHPNVRNWSEKTRKESIKIYRRMLSEAGFIEGEKLTKPYVINDFFYPFIKHDEAWFLEACFLSQAEREKVLNQHNAFKS